LADGDFIDFRFSNGLLKKGYRLGICTGIYMLHYYRMHQKDQREHQHLLA
jgi:GT2 family glycosyltransferase